MLTIIFCPAAQAQPAKLFNRSQIIITMLSFFYKWSLLSRLWKASIRFKNLSPILSSLKTSMAIHSTDSNKRTTRMEI